MSGWSLTAKLAGPKKRFGLEESVLVRLEAVFDEKRVVEAPVLEGGKYGGPSLEVRRNGGAARVYKTAVYNLSVPVPVPRSVSGGVPLEGTLDLRRWVRPLAAGSYEVVVILPDHGVRSEPVRFVVEELRVRAFAAEPGDAGRDGPRAVARIEERSSGTVLVFASPDEEDYEALDLGPIGADARVLLSTAAPRAARDGRWLVAFEGKRLRRFWVDGSNAEEIPGLEVELEAPVPLVALEGVGAPPRPVPSRGAPPAPPADSLLGELTRPPVLGPELGAGSAPGRPALHLAFAAERNGKPELVGLTLDPEGREPPRVDRVALPAAPVAWAGLALAPDSRRVFVAVESGALTTVLAVDWKLKGFEPPREVLGTLDRFLAFDATAESREDARVAALFHHEREGALELAEARIGASSSGALLGSRVVAADELPRRLQGFRVRVGPRRATCVLAEQLPTCSPVLVALGSPEVVPLEVEHLPWDVALSGADAVAIVFAPELGTVRRTFPVAPRPASSSRR